MPSLGVFCGALGWVVVAQAAWMYPLLPRVSSDADTTCLITQVDVSELRCAVAADDGYVYDAQALREWLRRCAAENRPPCVIPGKEIGAVWPVRSSPPVRAHAVRPAPSPPYVVAHLTLRSVATQTDPPPRKRPRTQVRIPSEHSAFRTVCAKGAGAACARR